MASLAGAGTIISVMMGRSIGGDGRIQGTAPLDPSLAPILADVTDTTGDDGGGPAPSIYDPDAIVETPDSRRAFDWTEDTSGGGDEEPEGGDEPTGP